MQSYDWTVQFKSLYDKAVARYHAGHRDPETLFTADERRILDAIGARPMELIDFAEDASGLPWETALLIVSARRDYFRVVQHGVPSARRLTMSDYPAKDAELEGIAWLPRLILKATSRLRGEMPEEMMYCCGGDRRFFKQYDIHPADFLRFVWSADGDAAKVLAYIKAQNS